MTDQSDNLVLEHLRALRDNDKKTHAELAELKHHLLALPESVSQLSREDAHIYGLISDHSARLERIEERLGLIDSDTH